MYVAGFFMNVSFYILIAGWHAYFWISFIPLAVSVTGIETQILTIIRIKVNKQD